LLERNSHTDIERFSYRVRAGAPVLDFDASSCGTPEADLGSTGEMRRPVVAGIIGALRAWTVAMISALSRPCRQMDVTPRLV
jgi:hypothetical protein